MSVCTYVTGHMAGEPLDTGPGRVNRWAEWIEYDCLYTTADEEGCPFLDSHDATCPMKEAEISRLEHWAIQALAGTRKDSYTRVRELMLKWEHGGVQVGQEAEG